MPFFGTDSFAAPGLGSIAGVVMLVFGTMWLNGRARRAAHAGEGYGEHPFDHLDASPSPHQPGVVIAIIPLVIVVIVNLVMTWWVIPAMELGYLAEPKFGRVGVNDVRGIWALVASLGLAVVTAIGLHWSR